MRCPIPKWIRRKLVPDCKEMRIGINDENLKRAAFVFIERHFKFCAPYEVFSVTYPDVEREGEKIGTYVVTIRRADVSVEEAKERAIE
ncbi:MAG: hypothetical protein HQK96_01645 [Nitrospirae bacterium]|nr:hypothetical protein [Nitrospirota bacterium]